MSERAELLVTALLLAACVLVAAAAVLPRVLVREADIRIEAPDIAVSVAGAVRSPGVYQLPLRSTVADLVEAAGGLTAEAEPTLLEMAAALGPGDHLHVPARTSHSGGERVSVNSASEEQLRSVPGIGPVTARRLVEGRPYSTLDDLLEVKGIGERTLQRLREHLRP